MLRKARRSDINGIQRLINTNLDRLLPRSDNEIYDLLPTFWVVEEDGEIVGCCCLEIYSQKIAELRSLAVREDCRGKGYGAALVRAATEEAERRNIRQVLVVTSSREFFERLDFGLFADEKYALFWKGNPANRAPRGRPQPTPEQVEPEPEPAPPDPDQ